MEPFELITMPPLQYDEHAGNIRRQYQMILAINDVVEHEHDILKDITQNIGLEAVIDQFLDKYPALTGTEIHQILHQGLSWPEDIAPGPFHIRKGGRLIAKLYAKTH